jgi:membrane protease YdiL (CAAX protease family)
VLEPASAKGFPALPEDPERPHQRDDPRAGLHPDEPDYVGPAAPTVLPVQRLGAAVEVLLCSGFPTQVLLIGVLTAFGLRMHTEPGRLSPLFVFTLSLLDTVLVVGLIFFFLRAHQESAREMFLGRRPVLREMLVGLIVVPALFALVFLVLALVFTFVPQLHNVERNPFEDMMQTRGDTLAFGVVVMVAGGVREEIQRGFILRRFQHYLGGGAAGIVVFSALFGLGHIEQGMDAALATALLGAAWGCLYLLRRSVVAPMVSHATFNLAQLLKFIAVN